MTARVLVVDDVAANRKLLEAKLNSEYYEVLTACNGIEAIQVTKQESPDIILLDVMMPEMDGFEACRNLKHSQETSHIPIVMVTALSEVHDRVEGLESGADDFLTKPINDHALFARIRSLLRLKQVTDELRLRDQTNQEFGLNVDDASAQKVNLTGSHVVVVNDDEVEANNIKDKLQELGCNVDVITDPEVVLNNQIPGVENIDLVIVSTLLINMDGLRLCSHLRNTNETRTVPILILIEEDSTDLLVKGLDIGVNDYIISPLDSNELAARARTQISKKQFQDALKRNYQQSVSMALTDSLTKVYNRRYFDVHFQKLLERSLVDEKPLSLMILDIDHFKMVNDTHGHVVGDQVLQELPERLIQNVRATDMIARYGGEEFVIIMPDSPLAPATTIAERVRNAVANKAFTVTTDDGKLDCTISIGIATAQPGDTLEMLTKRADEALYQSKEGGRNKVTTEEALK